MDVLDSAVSLHLNTRFRDRTVKILQYLCRLVLGYYKNHGLFMSSSTTDMLRLIMMQCSQGRRLFRVLKSIQMLQSIVRKYPALKWPSEIVDMNTINSMRAICTYLSVIENIAIGFYFICDSVQLVGRMKVMPYDVLKWDRYGVGSWFIHDCAVFSRILLTYIALHLEKDDIRKAIEEYPGPLSFLNQSLVNNDNKGNKDKEKNNDNKDMGSLKESYAQVALDANNLTGDMDVEMLRDQISALTQKQRNLLPSFLKNVFDIVTSGGLIMSVFPQHPVVYWLKENTAIVEMVSNDTTIGLFGALAGVTDMYKIISGQKE
jgi:hypothetical protein